MNSDLQPNNIVASSTLFYALKSPCHLPNMNPELKQEHGKGFTEKSSRRMLQFLEVFSEKGIVASLSRQFNWSYLTTRPPRKRLQKKLHQTITINSQRLESRNRPEEAE